MISIGPAIAKSRRSLVTSIAVLVSCWPLSDACGHVACSWPIVLHDVTIENATFGETVEYLRTKSRLDDQAERDPSKRGVNIVIMPPLSPIAQFARITLHAKVITLNDLVELVGKTFQMKVSSEPYAVVYSLSDNKMFIRSYRVPPIFRSHSSK